MKFEEAPYSSELVTPQEVMASDPTEARETLDREINAVQGEILNLEDSRVATDEPLDSRIEQLEARLHYLRVQRAELDPVDPSDDGEEL